MNADTEHRTDKLGLFCLAGMVVFVLGSIVIGIMWIKVVPDKADVLLSAIATGLILFLRDLVNAIRSSWESVTQAKTMDALSKSSPVDQQPVPADVSEAADSVADAAASRAGEISGQ